MSSRALIPLRFSVREHPILSLVAARVAISIPILFVVSILIFAATEVLPGDVASAVLGQSATPSALAALRAEFNLDQPAYLRYIDWLSGVLSGDLGTSFTSRRDITETISLRLGNTLVLAAATAIVTVPAAVFLGILSVYRHNGFLDRAVNAFTRATVALPEFFSGYLLIFVFAVTLGWLPSSAAVFRDMSPGARAVALILPCITLALAVIGHITTMTRAALLNVMSSPYIEMAELKGLSRWTIIRRHALPNAVGPIANVVALNLAYLVVGVVVVESVFVYPGMGQYMIDAVLRRDVPTVQACGLIFSVAYIVVNMLADIFALIANPRLRHPK